MNCNSVICEYDQVESTHFSHFLGLGGSDKINEFFV